ncbi:MAG TPA: class II fumarate hydratase, partial [Rhodanobacteraceae bacterium]|nr:class II fumarate hydratase [Rhodanobacteraceae bacterium]
MSKFRTEHDSMGELEVPADALWGAQTQRAVNNFPVSGLTMPREFIRALGLIKAAAAEANLKLGHLTKARAQAIRKAADKVASGEMDAQFPIDIFQTGSGTSSNMNANEVIAHLASTGNNKIHPNDHVNYGQSSNDVIPTAIHVSATLMASEKLLPALKHFKKVIDKRSRQLAKVPKTGRTHLMDAMPITFGQELSGWSAQVGSAIERVEDALKRMRRLPLGGSAVGTGINADPKIGPAVAIELKKMTKVKFESSDNYFEGISSQDAAVELSGALKTYAVSLMKIANDLRWMNSGPLAGLGEIELEALQPGSSIMPGKVNPVIPEAAAMVAAQVIGNDATITVGGQAGNFQLNVMLPVIAYNLLQSIEVLANVSVLMADKAIASFKVNKTRVNEALTRNPILVTALNPVIGYEKG